MSDSLKWVKAGASGSSGGNCVEVAGLPDRTRLVRDSRNPDRAVLAFGRQAWEAFAAKVKAAA
ncbi:MAG: DUF397 domain-containing protein [Streptosporangiaceae bacterium]